MGTDDAWRMLEAWLDRFATAIAGEPLLCEAFRPDARCLPSCRKALTEVAAGLLARTGASVGAQRGAAVEQLLRAVVALAVSPFLTERQRRQALAVLLHGLRHGARFHQEPDLPTVPAVAQRPSATP